MGKKFKFENTNAILSLDRQKVDCVATLVLFLLISQMQWKAYGTSGLSQLVETLFDNAEYFKDQVAKTPGFRLLFSDLQSVNICFWYIPSSMRGEEENEEWWQKLSKVYFYGAPRVFS